jgi:ubiquitin C-terminal hydrolase
MNGICGLGNMGNSCYVNATLQILAQIDELNDYLLKHSVFRTVPDSVITSEWIQLCQMIRQNHCSILPGRFIDQMRQVACQKGRSEFSSIEQNDAVDYLDFMLECFHESLDKLDTTLSMKSICKEVNEYFMDTLNRGHSIIPQLFMSCTLNRYINPLTKTKEFHRIEHEYRIGVSLPDVPSITLEDCLKETFKSEIMDGENAWYDEKDKTKKTVYKLSALCHTPCILILHLKRWVHLNKIHARVSAPFILDMTPYTIYKESCLYSLFGIINHEGDIGRGHYYSYVKKDQWYSLNDGFVQSISEQSLIHPENYCLFYRKIQ